jgi:hypothetical protein
MDMQDVAGVIAIGRATLDLVTSTKTLLAQAREAADAGQQSQIDTLLTRLTDQRETAVTAADNALDAAARR